ncbi:GDSL-type esterase/lipase family protein [Leptospira andrefontaineae]|uniref:Lipase n=1 Tax=Leptospira andrefontaineae TaxID=2484976 RepID=A0A4R9H2P0_9LEPT|nr:GDSL-type esterase/lipase family protein [Leptospira andrefontaineae]TGK38971.1 lipase [Leptospira andrefontaineae]
MKVLGICFFLLSLISCSVFQTRTIYDYYNPDFKCVDKVGIRDSDDWETYQKLYLEAVLLYTNENEKLKKANIVFVGNSLIAAIPPDLIQADFPGSVNRGIAGDMTELLLNRLDSTVLNLKPSTIILEIGGNDIRDGKCLDYIEGIHRLLIQKIRTSLPNTKVLILGIPPVLSRNVNSISPIVNAWLLRIANENQNVQFLDIWPEFRQKGIPFIREELAFSIGEKKDPIHINRDAYIIWLRKIKSLVK